MTWTLVRYSGRVMTNGHNSNLTLAQGTKFKNLGYPTEAKYDQF